MRTLSACQSNYIPWKGYFDLIASSDEFVIYDDVQYTRHDWRNRNRIKTAHGPKWLSIPVRVTGRTGQRIHDVEVVDHRWVDKHWRAIEHNYARAPFYATLGPFFADLYESVRTDRLVQLSTINERFLSAICELLEITTPLTWVMDLGLERTDRVDRLIEMCRALGAERYLTGPAARAYLDTVRFDRAGIELVFMDYSDYPEYDQLHPPFTHEVSIIDLVLSTGDAARRHLSFSRRLERGFETHE